MVNAYSRMWFELFLETRPYTQQEVAFVERNLPRPRYRRILDLCCGEGRHTNLLAQNGYELVGVDLDAKALAIAAENLDGAVTYLQEDMRALESIPGQFNAILSLWQSFGYFDEVTNRDVLRQISQKISSKGRFILDVYNRDYWLQNQGARQLERKDIAIQIENKMIGNRLRSSLTYGDDLGSDVFEWQLYTLKEISALGTAFGLQVILACTECDEQKPVTPEKPMMQVVFEKRIDS